MSSLILKRAKVIHDNSVNDNFLINGNFDIWQRGSSFNSSTYTADRWYFTSYGTNQAQRVNGNIGLDNTNNCIRLSTSESNSTLSLTQIVPTESTSKLRNKTVTLSFYARTPSGTNNWTGPIYGEVFYSTNIDNIVDSKILITDSVFSGTITGSYDWKFLNHSFTVPGNASTLAVVLRPSGLLNTDAKVDIARTKLEIGSLATPLYNAAYDQSLTSCKRFYQKIDAALKAGAGASSNAQKTFGYNTTLAVQPRIPNPNITIETDNSVAISNLSSSITNDSYLNLVANSNSPHSTLSARLVIDAELPAGRKPSVINFMDINRISGTINLDWNTPLYSEETTADYTVYYGTNPNNLDNLKTFVDSTGSLTGLSDFLPYYLKIKSTNPFGESDLSNIFSSAPLYTPPSAVASLTGTWGVDWSRITWTVPQNDGGSTITGYRIDRSMYSHFTGVNYTSTHYVPRTSTTFSIAKFTSELTTTGTYYFRVAAMNLAGTGTPTTVSVSKTTPSPPILISTAVGASQTVVISYSPPCNPFDYAIGCYGNGGATITQTQVQYSTGIAFPNPTTTGVTTNYQPITISGLTNNITYYFRIRHFNALGYGPYSQTFSAVPFRTPTVAGAPSGLSASWVDNDTVTVTWLAPADNGGVPLTNYTVYSSTGSTFVTNLIQPINTTNAISSITFDVPTSGSNPSLFFRTKANNSIGSSNYSASVSLAKQAPSEPTLLEAIRGDAKVKLVWSAPTTSKGSAITGYQINYSSSSNFASATTISHTGLFYDVSSLTNNTLYYFRVRAINSIGTGNYSNTLQQTPISSRTPPSAPALISTNLQPLVDNIAISVATNTPNLSGINFTATDTIVRVPVTTPYSGGAIYGVGQYSWDSDIRTAAIHAGALTSAQTGIVYLYTLGNLSYYNSGIRNGLTSTYRGSSATARSYKIVGSSVSCNGFWVPRYNPTTGTHSLTHKWTAPTNFGGSSITGYEIQSSTSATFVSNNITFSEPANTTVSSNCGSLSGNRIYSRIRAANTGGFSSWSPTITTINVALPYMPSFTLSALSSTGIRVVWTGATSDIERGYDNIADITYQLRISTSGSTNSLLSTTNFTNNTFPATGNVAIGPGKYQCSLISKNSLYSSLGQNKYIEVFAENNYPTTWIMKSSVPCCSASFTQANVNGVTEYYPNTNALKDGSSSSTFSTCIDLTGGSKFIVADFGSTKTVRRVYLRSHPTWSQTAYLSPHSLQGSNDNITWTTIGIISSLFPSLSSSVTTAAAINSNYRYIRIVSGGSCIDLSEFYFD